VRADADGGSAAHLPLLRCRFEQSLLVYQVIQIREVTGGTAPAATLLRILFTHAMTRASKSRLRPME
jgi:hypothetical protein